MVPPSIRPDLPDVSGWVDPSDTGVGYHLPHLPPADAMEVAGMVLAIDEIEAHVSRLRFALFLEQVVDAIPSNVESVCLSLLAEGRGRGPDWYVECHRRGHAGLEPSAVFLAAVRGVSYEDPGFLVLVQQHLGPLYQTPLTREALRELALAPLEPAVRAQVAARDLAATLPPPTSSRPAGRM